MQVAGIPKKLAPTIGIAVDHRRRNRSEESLAVSASLHKTYITDGSPGGFSFSAGGIPLPCALAGEGAMMW